MLLDAYKNQGEILKKMVKGEMPSYDREFEVKEMGVLEKKMGRLGKVV